MVLVATLEVAICAYMLDVHYLHMMSVDGFSLCDLSASWDCDQVARSWASEWFSIPLSWLGLVAYLLILMLLLLSKWKNALWAELMLYMLIGTVVVVDVFLAVVMLVDIQYYCIFCVSSYMLTLFLAVLVFLRIRFKGGVKIMIQQIKLSDVVKMSIVGVVCVLLLVLGGEKIKAQEANHALKGFDGAAFREAVVKSKKFPDTLYADPSMGNAKAKLRIIVFSDFQCPFCAESATSLKPIIHEYEDRIQFVFKNFPLGKVCNPMLQKGNAVDLHPLACVLAQLGEAAYLNHDFWKFHDYVFAHQQQLRKAQLSMDEAKNLVVGAGLDWSAVEKTLKQGQSSQLLMLDLFIAEKLGVTSTPTFFFNDLMIHGNIPPNIFRRMIEIYIDVLTVRQGNSK